MRGWKRLTWGVIGATAISGCAVSTPRELLDAREAVRHASASPAAQYSPDSLGQARVVLDDANRAFAREHASEHTRTLAYVALRKAQLAEAQARTVLAEQERLQAEQQLAQARAVDAERSQQLLLQARGDLAEAQRLKAEAEQRQREATQQQLTAQQQQLAAQQQQDRVAQRQTEFQKQQQEATRVQAEQRAQEQAWKEARERQTQLAQERGRVEQLNTQLEQERKARLQAEQRATQAETEARAQAQAQTEVADQLKQIREVKVKEESRGLVLTLSGSVLFSSGSAELLSPARRRLDEVADALKKGQNSLVIEGHSDSQGSPQVNEELSYLRAESVRRYLVDRGVEGSRIRSEGMGSSEPIASNATSEGRANNRRVEIVIQRGTGGSGPSSK